MALLYLFTVCRGLIATILIFCLFICSSFLSNKISPVSIFAVILEGGGKQLCETLFSFLLYSKNPNIIPKIIKR